MCVLYFDVNILAGRGFAVFKVCRELIRGKGSDIGVDGADGAGRGEGLVVREHHGQGIRVLEMDVIEYITDLCICVCCC